MPAYAQQYMGPGPQPNPHKLISERKRKVDALRDAFVAAGRAREHLALDIDAHLTAGKAGAADVRKFQDEIAAMNRRNERLEAGVTSALASRELAAFLANPLVLPDLAEAIPDDVGRKLLKFCSAYLGTQAYIDMAVAHSQQDPGDPISGPAAVTLARQLEALRIDHDRVVRERDQTIEGLQADLATAKAEGSASAALAMEQTAALEEQNRTADKALARLQETTDLSTRQQEELSSLQTTVDREIQARGELSDENKQLSEQKTRLREDNERLQKEQDELKLRHQDLLTRFACLTQLTATQEDQLLGGIEERDKIVRKIQTRLDEALGSIDKHDRTAQAKAAEAKSVAVAAENKVAHLQRLLDEANEKLNARADEVARLRFNIRVQNHSAVTQAQTVSSLRASGNRNAQLQLELDQAKDENVALQRRLTGMELECVSLKAEANGYLQAAREEEAKAQVAIGDAEEVRVGNNETICWLQAECEKLKADSEKTIRSSQAEREKLKADSEKTIRSLRAECEELKADRKETIRLFQAECEKLKTDSKEKARLLQAEWDRSKVESNKAVCSLETKCETLETEKRGLSTDLELLKTRLATSDKLLQIGEHEADRLSKLLQGAQTDAGELAIDCAAKEEAIRKLEGEKSKAAADFAVKADKTDRAAREMTGKLDSLRSLLTTAKEDKDGLCASLDKCQEQVRLLESQALSAKGSLEQTESDLAAEKEQARQNSQAVLQSLAIYFATGCAVSLPDATWVQFARAVQASKLSSASGPAPPLWPLEDGPAYPASPADLFAALCTRSWSARLCQQLFAFTATLQHADSANIAVVQLLVREAAQAAKLLDFTPAACICGLGICQLLVVVQARWPELDVPVAEMATHLASLLDLPVVDLVLGGELGLSDNRHDCGPVSLLSQRESPVGFIVDAESRCIRTIAKSRCRWATLSTVSVQAPQGPDLIIQIDSDTTFQWLFFHWVV